jgi:gluconolactonase
LTSEPVSRIVRDPRFERLVPATGRLIALAGGATWAEGPVYLPAADAVIWSDVRGNVVRRWSEATGVLDLYRPSDFANGHTLDHDGRVLACEHGPRRVARYEPDGSRTTIVDRYRGHRLNSPNDLVVASDGAIWFTDPPYGILDDTEGYRADSELEGCFVFRLDRGTGELTVASDAVVHPNGLAFSPDERTLYVSDTSVARVDGGNHHIVAFDVVDGRILAAPRVFTVIEPGVSDGLRVDIEGNVWTSAGDGIHVLAPDATELGRILLPEEASNCTFGGPDGRRLFITATSTLWSIEVGIRGAVTPWVDAWACPDPLRVRGIVEDRLGLVGAPGGQPLREARVGQGQDGGRQQARVHGIPDGDRGDRHATRHLDDREQ